MAHRLKLLDADQHSGGGWRTHSIGKVRSLLQCHFDVVDGCQLSCVGCPNSTLHPKVRRISLDNFKLCLSNIDVKTIHLLRLFNYGEPFLHDQLPSLIEQIPLQNWTAQQVEVSTNAQFVNWASLEAVLKTGVLTRLVVSCDGDGTSEDYERLRPPSKWEKLIEFLARAQEARDKLQPNLELMTRTICTDSTGQDRWRRLLDRYGWRPEFRGWINLVEASEQRASVGVGQGACSFVRQHTSLYVSADGSVVPCCYHPRATVLGSLMTDTFNTIMASERRQSFTSQMTIDRSSMAICGLCSDGGVSVV